MAQEKKANITKNSNNSSSSNDLQGQIDELRRLLEENLHYTKNTNDAVKSGLQAGLEKLLKENLKISKELLEHSQKIRRWVAWQRAWGVVKVLVIAIPIILGILYLPPLIHEFTAPFQDLLNFGRSSGDNTFLQNITDQFIDNEQVQ